MPTLGPFDIDAATAVDPLALEKYVRAIVDSGERVIRFSGCDYNIVCEIAARLYREGEAIVGIHCMDDPQYPPEYFIDGCSSHPVIRND